MRLASVRYALSLLALALALGCPSTVPIFGESESETDTESTTSTPTPPLPGTTGIPPIPTTGPQTSTSTTVGPVTTDSSSTTGGPPPGCEGENCAVDVLFVVDNSGTMGAEQGLIAGAMLVLEPQLQALGADVQVMFTTSDFGNPLCTPFRPDGYTPARGAPIDSACADRLGDFTGLGNSPEIIPEACTALCDEGVAPNDDPFVAFSSGGDNLPPVAPADVDGDGTDDSAAAQAMACLAPMGINGCGYESPLENMLQALNPDASWNTAARPFLRPEANVLAIAILTDEADCSVLDYDVMMDEQYQETDPDSMMTSASSAICWNAGVSCTGPDAMGVFSSCDSISPEPLQPVSRYTNYLVNELRDNQGKEVVMLGVVGVPETGVDDLVYRQWIDGEHPAGDILPAEFAQGINAADKQFDFGIGPGCTGEVGVDGTATQGIPPVRLREACEALNLGPDAGEQRCCLQSVCGDDYAPAMSCFVGLIENTIGG